MGYYDNDNDYKETEKQRSKPPRNGRGKTFLSGLLGAFVGIFIFFIASPYLQNHGLLPNHSNDATSVSGTQTTNTSTTTQPQNTKNVSLNVTDSVETAVDKVSSSVVAVINMQNTNGGFLQENALQETGIGSGIIYKKSGDYAYIVTNNHVVSGASKLEVQLDDNTKVTGKLLGADSLYDLAVIRIPGDKVTKVASLGDSSSLKRGEPVVAIGNPLGFSGSVTQGIVSSNERTIAQSVDTDGGQVQFNAQVIQTDAAINPGNSGGALINTDGQVVGINSEKIADTGVEGIGFAIPINVAEPIIKQLETTGKVERPYMGIGFYDLSELPASAVQQLKIPNKVTSGLVVSQISPGTPGSKADLQQGDVITAINGYNIKDYTDFTTYLYSKLQVGQTVKVEYYRDGHKKTTNLTLAGKTFS
ncbi:serine protease Do [Pullulanibacillus pueri]|uniref:Serine protease n=1 Tax=Pullulanibacillus pueri TaxID=1437324 RepID=A0A8J2ZVP5_9BACL|nr:trypsin-like peptidase domain-containing protein [Pullulanibacillus pueri]MBM7682239.1 serine protease Do [Pullulanibacillus pueri]GGH80569.1 serine protease [Pullulanibacillus pueri]